MKKNTGLPNNPHFQTFFWPLKINALSGRSVNDTSLKDDVDPFDRVFCFMVCIVFASLVFAILANLLFL